VRKVKVAIAMIFVAGLIALMAGQSLAYPPFVAKARKFGAKDCTFCHVDPEGGPPWNARGNWLIKEKERRGADSVDVEWLAEYKATEDKKDDKSGKTDKADKKDDKDKKEDKKDDKKTEPPKPPVASSASEQELLKTEREWLDAYVKRDAAALARIEAEDFMIVYADGRVLTRANEIDNMKRPIPEGPAPALSTEGTKVRIYGDTAVLTGVFVQKGTYAAGPKKGEPYNTRERYTDVYVKHNGQWMVVSSQLTSLEPPPASSDVAGLKLDQRVLDTYVGEYELPMFVLTITREADRLYGQPPGDSKRELLAQSETDFSVGDDDHGTPGNEGTRNDQARITFVKDQTGKVSGMRVEVNGKTFEGKKIK
jgi:ketosteroid isomerase-like protein